MARRVSLSKLLASGSSSTSPSPAASTDVSVASSEDATNKECAIKVVIRARPLNDRELLGKTPVIVNVTRTSVQVINPIVFLDPTYLEAISTPSKRVTQRDIPLALTAQGIAAATAAGECRTFHFDRCFGVDNGAANEIEPFAHAYDIDLTTQRPNQELIFDEIGRDMIDAAFQGFNCTVLAYGQTGSGKTHTMVGEKTMKGKGLIPRVCEALFTEIDARRAQEGDDVDTDAVQANDDRPSSSGGVPKKRATLFSAHVSYCEIYKEKVNDLLEANALPASSAASSSSSAGGATRSPPTSPAHGGATDADAALSPSHSSSSTGPSRRALRVREHPATGPFVEGLSSRPVTCYTDIADEMLAGEKLRTVASTLMNPVSSRSHAVFTITFTQTTFDPVTQTTNEKTSKISMIDLAGSERANASGTSGDRLKEGAMINKSLTTLGRVISALSKQGSERVPYRDSTLTWLLKESLGGNAKTTILAMVSPSSDNYEETMSTLRYAESAKRVINRAVVNEDKNARIIRELREEILALRTELETLKRSPRRRSGGLLRSASASPSKTDVVAAASIATSLAEREAFHAQLLQEVDELRLQQAMAAASADEEKRLATAAAAGDRATADATSSKRGSVYVHRTLPSLLAVVVDHQHLHPDCALAYVLVEGATVIGSSNDAAAAIDRHALTVDTKADDAPLPLPPMQQSPSKRSWSPTFLRRKASSTASASAIPTPATSTASAFASPRRDSFASASAAALAPSTPASTQRRPVDTQFYHLPMRTTTSDMVAQHVRITCTRPPDAAATTTDDTTTDRAIAYNITIEALDAHARVVLNHERLAPFTAVAMHHGDALTLGNDDDAYRFSLYVPLDAAARLATATVNPSSLPPLPIATAATAAAEKETLLPLHESLVDLVATANAICAHWHLHLALTLDVDAGSNGDAPTIVVKKRLDAHRVSVTTWQRPMLEAHVAFLRALAASLEQGEETVEDAAAAVEDEEEGQAQAQADVVVQENCLEDEERKDVDKEEEEEEEIALLLPPESDKRSSPRAADATTPDDPNTATSFQQSMPSSSSSSSLHSSSRGSMRAHHNNSAFTFPQQQQQFATCIRLLGHGRVFMPPLKSFSSGPMIAGVFDGAGHSIGKLFVHLHYTTNAADSNARQSPRASSLLSIARRPSLRRAKGLQATMRIQIDKVVFDTPQRMASDGISLTLKRSSSSSLSIAPTAAAANSNKTETPTPNEPTANFSTPKVPPLVTSSEDATANERPFTVFPVYKGYETQLCFGAGAGTATTAATTIATQHRSNSSGGAAPLPAQDDFVAFEVWGYGAAVMAPTAALDAPTDATARANAALRNVEFYVSVDVDEREHDGIYRPVAVKADGTLRLHANQPRRLNVRITQADQQRFALVSVASVRLAKPFTASIDTTKLSTSGGKSTQWLLSPSSIRRHSIVAFEDSTPAAATAAAVDAALADADDSSNNGVSNTVGQRSASSSVWRTLAFRAASEQDASSRSLTASLKWDRNEDAAFTTATPHELPDRDGTRSVFRVVVAFTTVWSRVPIVVSKSVATKIAPAAVSTPLKLARDLETSRTAWWARESFSRDYRLGTWYTADVTAAATMPLQSDAARDADKADDDDDDDSAARDTQASIVNAVVASHLDGLERLERALELEHLRQQILKMTPFSATETVAVSPTSSSTRFDVELSFDKVAASLTLLFESSGDTEQRFEIVTRRPQTTTTQQLFLCKKTYKDLLIGVKYGTIIDLRAPTDATASARTSWRDEVHSAHFVTEPSHLTGCAVGEMAGFLMLSTAFHLDDAAAAAAVIAPTPASPMHRSSSKSNKASTPGAKAVKANWERRWFVLKRPFLYAYRTFAVKEEVGVLDISRCQLLTASHATGGSSTGRRDSRSGSLPRYSSSSLASAASATARNAHTTSSNDVLGAMPFSFQLVCLVGAKCVVWTLQASTASEMRAWLVAIDPLKIEAREAVVSNNQSNADAPVMTA